MNLKISAWSAIANAIIVIPLFVIGFIAMSKPEVTSLTYSFIFLSLISVVIGILIIMGFITLANFTKNKFLRNMAFIFIIVAIIASGIEVFTMFQTLAVFDIVILILIGIISILFGISVLKLKEAFGGIVTALGVLYIIEGVFEITIILTLLVPLTTIIISVLEAIFFFRASKKYD
jgi:hypothetical protein|tara:strand:- start:136 stop:663 length:528 start_codon:yes stop_codon:yes gene_type:complete